MTLLAVLCLFTLVPGISSKPAYAQDNRKVKVRVEPEYPELAKRNNIHGTARVQLVIAPEGNVKDVRILGGSPVLAQAAVDAVKKWKYEPAAAETITIVKFEFTP
jgi:TonB family protein